ncbi:TcaA NTF2-like domain-containing protein, partial [Metabacillus fastidiosus]|uniref:TcaA NTF2-like domain-containing protein n=1 Tax=Metabacillus fastidiosus TaxID=1458 RepID=UPI002DC8CAE2|nr:hypothetical protein [Metabacillus fastidiosus]
EAEEAAAKEAEEVAAKGDIETAIEIAVTDYVQALTQAINYGNFDYVEKYLLKDSPLHNSQKELVGNLYSKNIKEEAISIDIHNITPLSSNSYLVDSYEEIEIIKPQSSEIKNYYWTYTVVIDNNGNPLLSSIK